MCSQNDLVPLSGDKLAMIEIEDFPARILMETLYLQQQHIFFIFAKNTIIFISIL